MSTRSFAQTRIETEINIQATPAQVWAVLTDFAAYPDWNPFIKSIEGEVAEGNKIKAVITDFTFRPRVLSFKENKELVWLGNFGIRGLFDGEHHFEIEDNGDGTVTLHHFENFKGLLLPMMRKKLETDTAAGFQSMNEALKARVEGMKG
ncbi:MAG: SRPBCC domain-containing protein [Bacteroidota bacterium]